MNDGEPNRREVLSVLAGAFATLATGASGKTTGLGVGIHSYGIRSSVGRSGGGRSSFSDPLRYIEYCRQLGAGGIQTSLGTRDDAWAAELRRKAESYEMFVEGSIRMPRDRADLDRFESEVRTAQQAGVTVIRSVMMGGRRYEVFDKAEQFQTFADRSCNSLQLAEPIVAKHRMRLAIENHKDWRIHEMLSMLSRISSQYVGVCVDTGNSIALLEEPMEVVEAYAPRAFSVHLKDMAVREYDEGFLLAEVPLGQGILDLPKTIRILRQSRPRLRFSLEMITRDPLKIPCLTDKYWATLEEVGGRRLARILAIVRANSSENPLPRVNHLPPEKRMKIEDDNVRKCLAYAGLQLGL